MTKSTSERWPCELRRFTIDETHSLPPTTLAFLRDVGFPRCFQSYARIEFRDSLEFVSAPEYQWSSGIPHWPTIAEVICDQGDEPAHLCLNPKGEVHFVCLTEDHGVLTELFALSVENMADCMLGILEWHKQTTGSLENGDAVMRLLRLVNRPSFFLGSDDTRCSICQSSPRNSAGHYVNEIYTIFSAESNGEDYFPTQIDVSCH